MTAPVDSSPQAAAVVAQVSPLLVTVHGATVSCPADSLASATLTLADPVQLTLRTPRRPLVQGVVS